MSERTDNDARYMADRAVLSRWVVLGLIIASIALLIGMVIQNVGDRLNNADDNKTARDRIAACVQSSDVVGCLNAAKEGYKG